MGNDRRSSPFRVILVRTYARSNQRSSAVISWVPAFLFAPLLQRSDHHEMISGARFEDRTHEFSHVTSLTCSFNQRTFLQSFFMSSRISSRSVDLSTERCS